MNVHLLGILRSVSLMRCVSDRDAEKLLEEREEQVYLFDSAPKIGNNKLKKP